VGRLIEFLSFFVQQLARAREIGRLAEPPWEALVGLGLSGVASSATASLL
jgi:hypothetical protein